MKLVIVAVLYVILAIAHTLGNLLSSFKFQPHWRNEKNYGFEKFNKFLTIIVKGNSIYLRACDT